MKRHGFKGQGASHGAHRVHRRPARSAAAPPRPRLQGHPHVGPDGQRRVTTQNLLVHKVDAENGVLLIKGAIPGRNGGSCGPHRSQRVRSNDKKIDVHTRAARRTAGRAARRAVRRRANIALMHQVVVAQLAAKRQGTHSTKTRGEVSGGGKKPYRQKGTGRARQGSTRAPQFTGGGIVHGPQPRDYSQRTPRR
jgi:hypothetical protein